MVQLKKLALSFILSVIGLIAVLLYVKVEVVLSLLLTTRPDWVLLAIIAYLTTYFTRALRWRTLLLPVKNAVSFSNSLNIIFAGLFVNSLIPIRLGEFLRAGLLQLKEKIRFFEGLSSIIVERFLDLLCITTLVLLGLIFLPVSSEGVFGALITAAKIVAVLSATAIFVFFIISRRRRHVLNVAYTILEKMPFGARIRKHIQNWVSELINGMGGIAYTPASTVKIILQSFLVWLLHALMAYSILRAFNVELPYAAVIIGSMLFFLSFALPAPPSYVGSYQFFWVLIFTSFGVPFDIALSSAILSHLVFLGVTAMTGCYGVVALDLKIGELIRQGRRWLQSYKLKTAK